ncbi:hypothetical protein Mapa_007927 [Marchantia paleacea]|nr:hypothetical protein Mapa_007927 [Marchantia paleacea]
MADGRQRTVEVGSNRLLGFYYFRPEFQRRLLPAESDLLHDWALRSMSGGEQVTFSAVDHKGWRGFLIWGNDWGTCLTSRAPCEKKPLV